ncbi:hypothetical protein SAMN05444920_109279 [Nonomuraea solani]|uniref:Uncharacterized protein n=1 Tax=Nonomuraea solani TaxID=1144553 RepID=A0A1H6EE46_9ACTN|nr:hypothetical protein [Nonomuraea solani]SEG96097.1 hypothetical protein SAMN05444920_109279 [Nonomuraea solani]
MLEIGAGFNTPSVIRPPAEHITRTITGARLVRVNLAHPQIPGDLTGRALPVECDAGHLIAALIEGDHQ